MFFENTDWLNRKGTTGKIELCAKFLEEEKILFQRSIFKFVSEHDVSLYLVINKTISGDLDKTSLSCFLG